MYEPNPLEILFLTNFSDSCYRAIPAVARIADELLVQLTILHCYDPSRRSREEAESLVTSFFPEADHYGICRRMAMECSPLKAVQEFRQFGASGLLLAPASDPFGIPRLGRASLRCQLIRESSTPVWTIGPNVQLNKLHSPTRNVACWIDLASRDKTHIKLAFEYAWKLDAKLHFLHALPEINEGSLSLPLHYDKPLHAEGAAEEIREIVGWVPIHPEIHVNTGNSARTIARMLRKCEADVLFIGRGKSIQRRLIGSRLNPVVDQSPCPVICVDGESMSIPIWKLERGAAFQASQEKTGIDVRR